MAGSKRKFDPKDWRKNYTLTGHDRFSPTERARYWKKKYLELEKFLRDNVL